MISRHQPGLLPVRQTLSSLNFSTHILHFGSFIVNLNPDSCSQYHIAPSDGPWAGLVSGVTQIPVGGDSFQVSHVLGWWAVQ